jgi:hypothetical protein
VSGNGWFLGKSESCIRARERAREITKWEKCVLGEHTFGDFAFGSVPCGPFALRARARREVTWEK